MQLTVLDTRSKQGSHPSASEDLTVLIRLVTHPYSPVYLFLVVVVAKETLATQLGSPAVKSDIV